MVKPRSLLQQIALWVGMFFLGIPISLVLANFFNIQEGLFSVVYASWIFFCLMVWSVARWVGGRALILWFLSILPGIALAFFIMTRVSNDQPDSLPAPIAFFGVIGIWTLLTSILSRNEKLMYLGLHIVNWFLFTGFFIVSPRHNFYDLSIIFIPVAISLILFGCYQPMIQFMASMPIIRRQPVQPQPKRATGQYQAAYGEGYRQTAQYTEGTGVYSYQPQPEQAQTQYPQQMQ